MRFNFVSFFLRKHARLESVGIFVGHSQIFSLKKSKFFKLYERGTRRVSHESVLELVRQISVHDLRLSKICRKYIFALFLLHKKEEKNIKNLRILTRNVYAGVFLLGQNIRFGIVAFCSFFSTARKL